MTGPMQWILIVIMGIALFTPGCQQHPSNPGDFPVLKIGTIHRAKSKNILFDDALGLFSMISHPPLLELKRGGEFSGILAEQFSYSDDYRVWTFRLKSNFFWSDGEPVTPEDIRFTLWYKARHLPSRKWINTTVETVNIQKNGTIVCTLTKPYTRFDIEFTSIRIFPAHIWKRVQHPRDFQSAVQFTGCGPFVIHHVDLNSGVVSMVRNPFWKGALPHLRRVEIHMYHTSDVLSLAMKRGDMDTFYKYADTFPYENVAAIRKTGRYKIESHTQSGFIFLGFNLRKHPTGDPALRQAIAHCLNYREIKKLITRGFGDIPPRGLVPAYFRFYHPTEALVRDTNRARTILRKSGYHDLNGDGILEDPQQKSLELKLVSTPPYVRLSELIKDYLNSIGLRVYIQILDPLTWIQTKDRYDYHLTISRTTPWGMMMHANWSTGYFDYRRSGQGVLHTIDDPEYIHLCDAALATKDPVKLKVLSRKIQEYHATRLPAVPLVAKTDVVPSKKNLSGWYHDPLFGIYNLRSLVNLRFSDANH